MIRLRRFQPRAPREPRPGQALVEFVLIAPILLLIILGIVEFARAWSAHHVIADATREGARLSAIADQSIGPPEVSQAIKLALVNGGLDSSNVTITVTDNGGERSLPSTVYVEYPYRLVWLAPFMNWASGDETVTLKSRMVMRNE